MVFNKNQIGTNDYEFNEYINKIRNYKFHAFQPSFNLGSTSLDKHLNVIRVKLYEFKSTLHSNVKTTRVE